MTILGNKPVHTAESQTHMELRFSENISSYLTDPQMMWHTGGQQADKLVTGFVLKDMC